MRRAVFKDPHFSSRPASKQETLSASPALRRSQNRLTLRQTSSTRELSTRMLRVTTYPNLSAPGLFGSHCWIFGEMLGRPNNCPAFRHLSFRDARLLRSMIILRHLQLSVSCDAANTSVRGVSSVPDRGHAMTCARNDQRVGKPEASTCLSTDSVPSATVTFPAKARSGEESLTNDRDQR